MFAADAQRDRRIHCTSNIHMYIFGTSTDLYPRGRVRTIRTFHVAPWALARKEAEVEQVRGKEASRGKQGKAEAEAEEAAVEAKRERQVEQHWSKAEAEAEVEAAATLGQSRGRCGGIHSAATRAQAAPRQGLSIGTIS
jgi:hypothetical protein